MNRVTLFIGLVLITTGLFAQNIGKDVERMLRQAPAARAVAEAGNGSNPAMDSIVYTLAYYGGAPDYGEVHRLYQGVQLLEHYADNDIVRQFLIDYGLDTVLDTFVAQRGMPFMHELFYEGGRLDFLYGTKDQRAPESGKLRDLDEIRNAYLDLPARPSLAGIAQEAETEAVGRSSAQLVGNTLAGLSDWISRRSQEELTYNFLTQLRENIRRNGLDHLFPHTSAFLPDLDLLNYRAVLPSVRKAFIEDLNTIAYNLGNYLEVQESSDLRDPAVYSLFLLYQVLDLDIRDVPLTQLFRFTLEEIQAEKLLTQQRIDLALAEGDTATADFRQLVKAFRRYSEGGVAGKVTEPEVIDLWLQGREPYDHYVKEASLARFDQLFADQGGRLPPQRLRAAGLSAIRMILAEEEEGPTLAAIQEGRVPSKQNLIDAIEKEQESDPSPALDMLLQLTRSVEEKDTTAADQLRSVESRFRAYTNTESSDDEGAMTTDDGLRELRRSMQAYSTGRADTLVRAFQNQAIFEKAFLLAAEVFFLLSDNDSYADFIPNADLAVFQTDPVSRDLLTGLATERMRRVSEELRFDEAGLADVLLDFGLYLSEWENNIFSIDPNTVSSATMMRRLEGINFVTQTIEHLTGGGLLVNPLDAEAPLSLAEYYPEFAKVPGVSKELRELFRLSQTKEYRYAMGPLLNLLQLFEIAPTAGKKQRKLTERRDELGRLLSDYAVAPSKELAAVGLGVPSAEALPLFGDNKRDRVQLARYQSELKVATDEFSREDAANSIRDLKISRLREELQEVEEKLAKVNPTRADRFRKELFRYGTFMADVAAADDPEEFETALSTVALPAGSSQIKRNRPSSFELGAYFGIAAAGERLDIPTELAGLDLQEDALSVSLFVPVGFSYSKRLGSSQSSITFFGSLIDVGALTALRLEDGNSAENADTPEVERLPEFRWANIVAPGAHLMYNFPRSPFTLGVGIQDGPSFRKISVPDTNREFDARSFRAMVTLSIDVPIFRFFNR